MKILYLLYPLPLIIFVLIWHLLTGYSADRQFIFSSPALVTAAFTRLLASGELLHNTEVTVGEAVAGFFASVPQAVPLSAYLSGHSKIVAAVARPYITALGTVPIFALAPMVIVWFGIGLWSKIMLAFLATVAVAIVQSYQGAVSIEPRYLRLMKVVGASRWQTFRLLVIPSSLIWVINALRLNIGLALLGAFIGEFISSEEGLGYMINKASGLYDMATVYRRCNCSDCSGAFADSYN